MNYCLSHVTQVNVAADDASSACRVSSISEVIHLSPSTFTKSVRSSTRLEVDFKEKHRWGR